MKRPPIFHEIFFWLIVIPIVLAVFVIAFVMLHWATS
jgi:hypothetical protein